MKKILENPYNVYLGTALQKTAQEMKTLMINYRFRKKKYSMSSQIKNKSMNNFII